MKWQKEELFVAKNGETAVRYALSDGDGVTFELSMHDDTIKSLVPQDLWFPVHAAPTTNVKIERKDGWAVVLCGFGKPRDDMGNLVLMRLKTSVGFSVPKRDHIIQLMLITLMGLGIQPNKNMFDSIRGN